VVRTQNEGKRKNAKGDRGIEQKGAKNTKGEDEESGGREGFRLWALGFRGPPEADGGGLNCQEAKSAKVEKKAEGVR